MPVRRRFSLPEGSVEQNAVSGASDTGEALGERFGGGEIGQVDHGRDRHQASLDHRPSRMQHVAFVGHAPHANRGRANRRRGPSMDQHSTAASTQRFFSASLAETDPALAAAIRAEFDRQQDGIELIASENIVSAAVLEAQGSVLTNKYAEGYPGRRYYGGCGYVDVAENSGDRAGEATVRLRVRQCAAAFGRAGQSGGVPGAAATRRHGAGHESGRGWAPDPRRGAQPVRQVVPGGAVWRAAGRWTAGL